MGHWNEVPPRQCGSGPDNATLGSLTPICDWLDGKDRCEHGIRTSAAVRLCPIRFFFVSVRLLLRSTN